MRREATDQCRELWPPQSEYSAKNWIPLFLSDLRDLHLLLPYRGRAYHKKEADWSCLCLNWRSCLSLYCLLQSSADRLMLDTAHLRPGSRSFTEPYCCHLTAAHCSSLSFKMHLISCSRSLSHQWLFSTAWASPLLRLDLSWEYCLRRFNCWS